MDYLALRIPADTSEKMTSSTWTDEPPFHGSNGMYEQIKTDMIEIVRGLYYDQRARIELDGNIYCDEEGRLKGREVNWRASQLRHWLLSREMKLTGATPKEMNDVAQISKIVGDACFVVPGTKTNIKIMEAILDS